MVVLDLLRCASQIWGELNLTDREIACQYCRSIFTLSESKNVKIRAADSSLSKQELDAA
jgi:hypothetical protein